MDRTCRMLFYLIVGLLVVFVLPRVFNVSVENYDNNSTYPDVFAQVNEGTADGKGVFSPDFEEPEMGSHNNDEYSKPVFDYERSSILNGNAKTNWISPAWDPEQVLSSDAENDPRMIYNKCSLSCCTQPYASTLTGKVDPDVFDDNGNKKYISTNYNCQNTCGSGCVCLTKTQANNFNNGTTY